MARPTKPFFATWIGDNGTHVTGLAHDSDGRWRVTLPGPCFGKKYREPDARKAVDMFYAMTGTQPQPVQVFVSEVVGEIPANFDPGNPPAVFDLAALDRAKELERTCDVHLTWETENTKNGKRLRAGVHVPERILWAWVNEQMHERRAYVAEQLKCPAIMDAVLPKPALKLSAILAAYQKHADVKAQTKAEWSNTFETFAAMTSALTLADLSTEVLMKYRDEIRSKKNGEGQPVSPGTIQAYFGRVKGIIAFAKTQGLDAAQIDAALSRTSVLKAPKDRRVLQPTPIGREAFHALLKIAREQYPEWEARLLIMLNLCLHFDEALDVEWSDFDFAKNVFCTKRNKRGRVIRAACIWPETLAILKAIPRTGSPFVFVSTHGTRYNAKGAWKTWNKLRTAAGLPSVQMDDLRDGAYTAACNAPGVEEKFARLLAGHRSHGLQDNYVARNPAIVRPACDAVRAGYFAEQPVK